MNWPKRALNAITYLFRPLQDLDVYVEDVGEEVFYAELLRRIAQGRFRVARVFPAGNRTAVIEKAKEYDFSSRPALFIIDGDLEWVRGESPPSARGLYRLEAYCIENLLIHETAGVQIVAEEAALPEPDAKARLRCASWLQEIKPLIDLFISFAALNAANSSEATVKTGVGKVITSRKGKLPTLDAAKVEQLRAQIDGKAIAAIGVRQASELRARIRARVKALPSPIDIVSGKDFLLPLFEFHLWGCTNKKTVRRSLKVRLARHSDPGRFAGLAHALTEAGKSG